MSNEVKSLENRHLAGNFLVASPYLPDSPYRRTVVLVARHDPNGALGFVMDERVKSGLMELDAYVRTSGRLGSKTERPLPTLPLFSGIIRWPAARLDSELGTGIWMVTPARLEFSLSSDDLWTHLVRKIGRDVLTEGVGIKSFPTDIRLN